MADFVAEFSWHRAVLGAAISAIAATLAFIFIFCELGKFPGGVWFAVAWVAALAPNYVMLGALETEHGRYSGQ